MNEGIKLRTKKTYQEYIEHDKEGKAWYVKSEGYMVEKYGFYLRCFGAWFRPCVECQGRLAQIVKASSLSFGVEDRFGEPIGFERIVKKSGEHLYHFFLREFGEAGETFFAPCDECQKELDKIVLNADEIIIGNGRYEPSVELYMSCEIPEDLEWKVRVKRLALDDEIDKLIWIN